MQRNELIQLIDGFIDKYGKVDPDFDPNTQAPNERWSNPIIEDLFVASEFLKNEQGVPQSLVDNLNNAGDLLPHLSWEDFTPIINELNHIAVKNL